MESPLWDTIIERTKNWQNKVASVNDISELNDLYTKDESAWSNPKYIQNYMLVKHRNYFVKVVKKPLVASLLVLGDAEARWWYKLKALRTIVKCIRKYPNPTKGNTGKKNTHARLDILDKFNKLNRCHERSVVLNLIFRLYIDECEHDGVYDGWGDFWFEEQLLAVLENRWETRPPMSPKPRYWGEETPYGGRETIVWKLWKHREEILKIIGEDTTDA